MLLRKIVGFFFIDAELATVIIYTEFTPSAVKEKVKQYSR